MSDYLTSKERWDIYIATVESVLPIILNFFYDYTNDIANLAESGSQFKEQLSIVLSHVNNIIQHNNGMINETEDLLRKSLAEATENERLMALLCEEQDSVNLDMERTDESINDIDKSLNRNNERMELEEEKVNKMKCQNEELEKKKLGVAISGLLALVVGAGLSASSTSNSGRVIGAACTAYSLETESMISNIDRSKFSQDELEEAKKAIKRFLMDKDKKESEKCQLEEQKEDLSRKIEILQELMDIVIEEQILLGEIKRRTSVHIQIWDLIKSVLDDISATVNMWDIRSEHMNNSESERYKRKVREATNEMMKIFDTAAANLQSKILEIHMDRSDEIAEKYELREVGFQLIIDGMWAITSIDEANFDQ